MASEGPEADRARAAFRARIESTGHAVDNVRGAVADLNVVFEAGVLRRTPEIEQMLEDLHVALEQDEGQKLGGKSAEAARFIARALSRQLDRA